VNKPAPTLGITVSESLFGSERTLSFRTDRADLENSSFRYSATWQVRGRIPFCRYFDPKSLKNKTVQVTADVTEPILVTLP
jgi:hypothetical protein